MAYETGTKTDAESLFDAIGTQLQSTGFMGSGNEWTQIFHYDGYKSGEDNNMDSKITFFEVPGASGAGDYGVMMRLQETGTNTVNILFAAFKSYTAMPIGTDTWTWKAAWSSGSVSYVRGDVVSYSGSYYVCDIAHTSDATLPTAMPATWTLITDTAEWIDADDHMVLTEYHQNSYTKMWDGGTGDIKYWMLLDKQRLMFVTKCDGKYHFAYVGGIDTPLPLSVYPMPVLITNNTTTEGNEYTNTNNYNFPIQFGSLNAKLVLPEGGETGSGEVYPWPLRATTEILTPGLGINPNGDRALEPVLISANDGSGNKGFYGTMIGVYGLYTGVLISEDILTIGGDTFLVIEDVYRGAASKYIALKLD